MFDRERDPIVQLRAMLALNAVGAADPAFLRMQLKHPDEHIRASAIRLLTDDGFLAGRLVRRP